MADVLSHIFYKNIVSPSNFLHFRYPYADYNLGLRGAAGNRESDPLLSRGSFRTVTPQKTSTLQRLTWHLDPLVLDRFRSAVIAGHLLGLWWINPRPNHCASSCFPHGSLTKLITARSSSRLGRHTTPIPSNGCRVKAPRNPNSKP